MSTPQLGVNISAGRMAAAQAAMDHMRGADSALEAKNQEKTRRVHQQMARMPWNPGSIVSLHAFPLTCSNILLNELRLAAAPLCNDDRFPVITLPTGRRLGYTHHVISRYAINMVPNDAGEIEPSSILPLDLALSFLSQYHNIPQGGVFCYEGSEAPHLLGKDTPCVVQADRSGQTQGTILPFIEAVTHIHRQQVEYYMNWKGEADEAANGTDEKRRNIIGRSNVVKMVRMLRAWGELGEDPAWMKSPAKRSSAEPVICKSCGTEAKSGALKCTNGTCTYVFDPFAAFKDLVIDLQSPGAGLALRRLDQKHVWQLINWKRFTKEEAEEAGYKFKGKDVPTTANSADEELPTDPNAQSGSTT